MKKRYLAVGCVALILTVCLSQTAFAGERFGVGANVSFMGVADTGSGDEIQFDGTTMIGVNATAYINSFMSVAVDFGYAQLDIDADVGAGVTVGAGELKQIPLLVTARLHLPLLKSVNPYVGAGLGYYFNDFDASEILALAGGNISADDNFAFHLNGGLEIFFGEHLALNVDLKYLWNEMDLKAPAAVLDDLGDLEMRTFIAGVGLRFYF